MLAVIPAVEGVLGLFRSRKVDDNTGQLNWNQTWYNQAAAGDQAALANLYARSGYGPPTPAENNPSVITPAARADAWNKYQMLVGGAGGATRIGQDTLVVGGPAPVATGGRPPVTAGSGAATGVLATILDAFGLGTQKQTALANTAGIAAGQQVASTITRLVTIVVVVVGVVVLVKVLKK